MAPEVSTDAKILSQLQEKMDFLLKKHTLLVHDMNQLMRDLDIMQYAVFKMLTPGIGRPMIQELRSIQDAFRGADEVLAAQAEAVAKRIESGNA